MFGAPVVLNALKTLAPLAQPASISPALVVWPISRPDRSGFRGFVQSTTTFPDKSPAVATASFVAGHGVASTTTSAPSAAGLTPLATDPAPTPRPAITALALAGGTAVLVGSEFVPAGVLPLLAHDLHVSEGRAGLAVAATALAGAVTAPTIASALPRVDRRRVLLGLMVLALISNALVAVAPTLGVLLVGRVLLGVAVAGYWTFTFGVGLAVTGRPALVSTAMSLGTSVATIVGSVGSGAEVLAGGSIHVYGALRGRAIAGLKTGAGARIFCRKLEAEMVGVDQLYRTAEHWGAGLQGRAVQVMCDRGALRLAAFD